MQVQLTVRHLNVDEGLKEYAKQKIVHAVEQLRSSEAVSIDIELSDDQGPRDGQFRTCKINVALPRLKPFHVVTSDADLRAAIDTCVDKLGRAIKRKLAKRKEQARHPKKQYVAKRELSLDEGEEEAGER